MSGLTKNELITLVVRVTVRCENAEEMEEILMEAVGEGPDAIYDTEECVTTQEETSKFNEAFEE